MGDRILRFTSVVFLAAVLVHGADHVRRGVDVVTTQVLVAGTVQFVLAVVAVALVFRGHRLAPVAAIAVGFASAVGFAWAGVVVLRRRGMETAPRAREVHRSPA